MTKILDKGKVMEYIYEQQMPKMGVLMPGQTIYDVNIMTSEKEVINLKVQGDNEDEVKKNLEEAVQKEEDILRGAESYEITEMKVDEELSKKFQDSMEEKKAKIESLKNNLAKYMENLRNLVSENESEKEKLSNGGFVFLMKQSSGEYVYGHCSKETMKKFQESGNIHVMPLMQFASEDLGI